MRASWKNAPPFRVAIAAAALAAIAWAPTAGAVEPDKFLVAKTSDIVALCTAGADDANHVAAIHFCHGFASGAFQYYEAIATKSPKHRFICLPDPAPTRSAAIGDFVEWTRKTPDALTARPVDSMFRYLHGRYPCPATSASLKPRVKP